MRERNETNFRNMPSKDGRFSPHLSKRTSERLTRYCKSTDQNKTKFAEKCINDTLDLLEIDLLQSKTKEELIYMLLDRKEVI